MSENANSVTTVNFPLVGKKRGAKKAHKSPLLAYLANFILEQNSAVTVFGYSIVPEVSFCSYRTYLFILSSEHCSRLVQTASTHFSNLIFLGLGPFSATGLFLSLDWLVTSITISSSPSTKSDALSGTISPRICIYKKMYEKKFPCYLT